MPAPGIYRGTWRHVPEPCLVLVDLMCRVPAGMYRGLVANLMYRGIYRVPGFSTSRHLSSGKRQNKMCIMYEILNQNTQK